MRVGHNTRHTHDTQDTSSRDTCCSPFSLHTNRLLYAEENRQAKPVTDIMLIDMAMVGIQWASPNQAGMPKPAQPVDRFQCYPLSAIAGDQAHCERS